MTYAIQDTIPFAAINAPELDGCGPLILSIVTKCSKKAGLNTEDLFQEAVIYYLNHRHQHDSSRGARTTFVHQLMRSFFSWKCREKNHRKNSLVAWGRYAKIEATTKATPCLGDDAQAIADASLLGSVRSVTGVAERMGWKYERAEVALEEMKQAYSKRIASKVWLTRKEQA